MSRAKRQAAKAVGLRIDIETRSRADLKRTGVYRYAEDPDFRVLLISYSIIREYANGQRKITRPGLLNLSNHRAVLRFQKLLENPRIEKHAYNAAFERIALSAWAGKQPGDYIDPTNWHCSAVRANVSGVFGSLDEVAKALRSPVKKDAEGRRLINLFSKPDNKRGGGFHDTGWCWCGCAPSSEESVFAPNPVSPGGDPICFGGVLS